MARTGGRKRDRLRWSKLYTFSCFRTPSTDEAAGPSATNGSAVGGPGFSRIVHCNNSILHRRKPLKYPTNYISTTKYNVLTFLPKAIFEQFRRVANLYFLLTAILSLTPVCPFSPVSMIAPLAFVVGLSMIKEALEDWRRFMQDMKVNNRKVSVHKGDGEFGYRHWEDLCVGDVVRVEKDQFFPADLLLLSSSYEDGICYVETMNLDGETNLKLKRSLEVTLPLEEDDLFKDFRGVIRCEDPNPSLYTFVGNLEYERQVYALDPFQILLRDSKLRNTSFIYGVVIFTGHDSKVMQNSTESPSKRSRIEKKMDMIIYVLFTVLVLISLISSIGFAVRIKLDLPRWWYLQPQNSNKLDDPSRPALSGIFHLITALILYGYLIPISLYVSIEVVKVAQAHFINQDLHMFDEETGNTAQARTSNLNEELGQVHTILSDKTGTLTCNQMDFLKCSIAGVSYGVRSSEVERAAAKQMASGAADHDIHVEDVWENNEDEIQLVEGVTFSVGKTQKSSIKGFSFEDDRLMHGNWTNEPNSSTVLLFFRILALCHTAIPEVNEATGALTYEAESPDEGAFLVAAREFGFEFFKRTQSSVFIREKHTSNGPTEREFKILNLLEFNSKRKRMTVILKDEDNRIVLLCKGAIVPHTKSGDPGNPAVDSFPNQSSESSPPAAMVEVAASRDEEEAAPLVSAAGEGRRRGAGAASETRDLHVLSSAFFFVFLAYHAAQNLQSTVNTDENLGSISLGLLYASFTAFSVVGSPVVRRLGSRSALVLGTSGYLLFIAANLAPSWYTMVPASLYLGFTASIIWVGQGTYLTSAALSHARDNNLADGPTLGSFNGEFWGVFASTQVIGNLISLALLRNGKDGGSVTGKNLLFVVFLGCMIIGIVLMCLLSKRDEKRDNASTHSSFGAMLKYIVAPLKDRRMLLLIPIIAYSGLQQAFVWAVFTKSIVTPVLGISGVGGAMAIYGASDVVCSLVAGRFTSGLHSATFIVSVGAVLQAVVLFWLLLFYSPMDGLLGAAVPLFIGALWGVGDGVLNTQLSALLGLLFEDVKEAAFAQLKVWQSGAIAVIFFLSPSITLQAMLILMATSLVISFGSFLLLTLVVEKPSSTTR